MINIERGEAALVVDAAPRALRFTLGALAEIEHALGVTEPAGLSARFGALTAADLQAVLAALLRAGGADDADSLAARADPGRAARAVAVCLKANLG